MLMVEIDVITAGPKNVEIPWLDPYKMVLHLAEIGKLEHLGLGQDLLQFWQRFAKTDPHHWIFNEASKGTLNLARTLPFYSHGDEGRGKRKRAVLLWSMRGCVGEGTELFRDTHQIDERSLRMGLNMGGSWTSRFLHCAVPKSVYGKVSQPVWDDLGFRIASAYRRLQEEGFLVEGRQYHAVCLGLTGDNPFLAKIAHLVRSFGRVPKKNGDASENGVCWRCLAGTPNIPFENMNMHPEWSHTIDEVLPWHELPPFLRGLQIPPDDPAAPSFLKFDLWHNWHGGLGKHMVASTIAELLPNISGTSMEKRMYVIQDAFQGWRQLSKQRLHAGILDLELFGLEGSMQQCPVGSWSKFNDTRVLLAFLEWFLKENRHFEHTDITEEALVGIQAANTCFRTLYASGYWMTRGEAVLAARAGMTSLGSYARLAHMALTAKRSRWPLVPKAHYIHHSMRDLLLSSRKHEWSENPLSASVQLDEDFVGHVSRLHRRVGSYLIMQRSLQRYKVSAWLHLTGKVCIQSIA